MGASSHKLASAIRISWADGEGAGRRPRIACYAHGDSAGQRPVPDDALDANALACRLVSMTQEVGKSVRVTNNPQEKLQPTLELLYIKKEEQIRRYKEQNAGKIRGGGNLDAPARRVWR